MMKAEKERLQESLPFDIHHSKFDIRYCLEGFFTALPDVPG